MATKKQIKAAEKAELKQLSDAQKAELQALKDAGATKAEIKAEKNANKTEAKNAKVTLKPAGQQTLLAEGQPTYGLLSAQSTYGNSAYAGTVQNKLNNVVSTYEKLGLTPVSSVTGTSQTGLNFNRVYNAVQTYDPTTGQYTGSGPIAGVLNTAQNTVGKNLTADQLNALGYNVKPVKGQDGLFQIKNKDDTITGVTYLRQNQDGTYTGVGSTASTALNVPTGFFTTDLGKALAIGGTIALALTPGGQAFAAQVGSTLTGGALAANSLAAQAFGQAVIRGVSTGAITGDLEKGLIAGAISGAGSALNLTGQMSNIFDSVGLSDYKEAFGVFTPGDVGAGAFDMAGAAGTGLMDYSNLGTGAFDIAGAAGTGLTDYTNLNTGAFDIGGAQGTGLFDAVANGLPVDAGAADITQIAGEAGQAFPDGLSYDPGAGYGTGAAGGMAGAEGLVGSSTGGMFGMGTAAGVLGTGLTAKELLTGANTARQVYNAVTGGGGAGGGTTGGAGGLFNNLSLGGVAGTAIDYAALQKIADEATGLGRQLSREAAQIGEQAQTPFTPYTLTTGAGSATISPGSATAAAAAPYEALRQQALTQAQQTLGAINPAQATQQFYGNLEALAAPTRQREQEALLGRLSSAGLLGIGRNLPTTGGTVRGVNPYLESLLSAQERGRTEQALTAQQYGTSEAARQQALAQGFQTQAMGIDRQTMEQLATARALGTDERTLAQQNARLRAQTALAGLELRAPYEKMGLLSQIKGIEGLAGGARGMLGLPAQPGYSGGGNNIVDQIFNTLLNQGMSADQAANYVSSISSGLDISGESEATQNLINSLQEYGIF